MKRGKFSTLIELLIGISLLSLLITVLMGGYSSLVQLNSKSEELRREAFESRYAQLRLMQVFSHISGEYNNSTPIFYTEEEAGVVARGRSLVFSFDNGAVIDPALSGCVLGKLFLTPEGELILAIWPMPKKNIEDELEWPPKITLELLKTNVLQVGFDFFYPFPATSEFGDTNSVKTGTGPEQSHNTIWEKEWKELPATVTLIINDKQGIKKMIAIPVAKGQKIVNYYP